MGGWMGGWVGVYSNSLHFLLSTFQCMLTCTRYCRFLYGFLTIVLQGDLLVWQCPVPRRCFIDSVPSRIPPARVNTSP